MRRGTVMSRKLMVGTSLLAMTLASTAAFAQEETSADDENEIIVTGIRASLKAAKDIKQNSTSVVDAITAEDIGKFPDTNLAESLQRITGVSIDRNLGEGATVTVRGFGADFNLVTLNGRTMPTSTTGDGLSAPSTRSYDFANIASEGIAGVNVYKTSRADVASGGIGATIDIRTTRPLEADGRIATVGFKVVRDESEILDDSFTPELSGLFADQFADGKFGISVSGSYQNRKGGVSEFVGYDSAYVVDGAIFGDPNSVNEWGALPDSPSHWGYWAHRYGTSPDDPAAAANNVGSPDPGAAYSIHQKAHYGASQFERTRLNGQLVMQFQPTDNITATADYTYASNEVETQRNTGGIWYNFNASVSSWTSGPVAGPRFYYDDSATTDLSFEGGLTKSKSTNESLGFNIDWQATDRFNIELDYHDSSAESGPEGKFGTQAVIGTAVVGVATQGVFYENDLPIISVTQAAGEPDIFDPANRYATGSAFRTGFMRADVEQFQAKGEYDLDLGFIDSVDFGASMLTNQVRTAHGTLQNNDWGGLGTPADYPDDLFTSVSISDLFDGISGADDPRILNQIQIFDAGALGDVLEQTYQKCSNPETGTQRVPGTCLAEFDTDRRLKEDTVSAYLQFNSSFDLLEREANLIVGARYEKTEIESSALVPTYNQVIWTGDNEINLVPSGANDFTTATGEYSEFLPNIYFDMQPLDDVKLRLAYSKTLARPTYDRLQGGLGLSSFVSFQQGFANQGNPAHEPYISDNFDVSLEWYYDDDSYISLGYYKKDATAFPGSGIMNTTVAGLNHPAYGPRADAARAFHGANATPGQIRQYIIDNFPATLDTNGNPIAQTDDELIDFEVSVPVISDESLTMDGWEFQIQHTFGETGFGGIFNYTIAEADFAYNNALVDVNQVALPGLSDSANLIAFYDKDGVQVRVAYNWRDAFLASAGGPVPWYTEAYEQIDAHASYEIRDGFTVFIEGIDITGTDRRGHGRHRNNATFFTNGQPRFSLGARYKF